MGAEMEPRKYRKSEIRVVAAAVFGCMHALRGEIDPRGFLLSMLMGMRMESKYAGWTPKKSLSSLSVARLIFLKILFKYKISWF